MASRPPDDTVVRPFADFLREQSKGALHEELSVGLHDLVEAVTATGRAGSITLTLKIKPATKGNTDSLLVAENVTVKAPTPDRGESIFFVDDNGNLSRRNPSQPELPLAVVSEPEKPTEPKAANGGQS